MVNLFYLGRSRDDCSYGSGPKMTKFKGPSTLAFFASVSSSVMLPLLFSRDHVRDRAKEAVGLRRYHGRRNGHKKRECRRPLRIDPTGAFCIRCPVRDAGKRRSIRFSARDRAAT
jgi:hypothetical protein